MSEFPECLLIVTAEVDVAIEAEWNRWYDTVHLPDALRCPGVRRGRRYMASGEITETAAGKTERTMRRILDIDELFQEQAGEFDRKKREATLDSRRRRSPFECTKASRRVAGA